VVVVVVDLGVDVGVVEVVGISVLVGKKVFVIVVETASVEIWMVVSSKTIHFYFSKNKSNNIVMIHQSAQF
jgi:hypothetical protein